MLTVCLPYCKILIVNLALNGYKHFNYICKMKTLKKINLRGLLEILSDAQLKNVLGGCGGSGSGGNGSGGSSDKICYRCSNKYECSCDGTDPDCYDDLADMCPGGWISWISGVEGPEC